LETKGSLVKLEMMATAQTKQNIEKGWTHLDPSYETNPSTTSPNVVAPFTLVPPLPSFLTATSYSTLPSNPVAYHNSVSYCMNDAWAFNTPEERIVVLLGKDVRDTE